MTKSSLCCVCGNSLPAKPDVSFPSIPVRVNLLTEEERSAPVWREPLALYTCPRCGLVQQAETIPPDKLFGDGSNYVGKWRFQPHLEAQLSLLNNTDKRERSCIEVGCHTGGFLAELRRRGWTRTCGIEANRDAAESARKDGIRVYNSLLTRDVCQRIVTEQGKFSLLVARHLLEHLPDLTQFFDCINILLADDGQIFLEVPDFEPLHTPLPWSFTFIQHEACLYFTRESLTNCLKKFSYKVDFLEKNCMGGGVLNCLASRNPQKGAPVYDSRHTPFNTQELEHYVGRVQRDVLAARARGEHVLLYGAGSHAIAFLSISGLQDSIELILDDVPAKHGLYMPGCPAKIVSPACLEALTGKHLILLAIHPEYEEECVKKIRQYAPARSTVHFLLSKRMPCTV